MGYLFAKIELKIGLNVNLAILKLINGCVKQSFDKKCQQWLHFFVNCTQNPLFFTLFCGCYIIYYYLYVQELTIQNKNS